MNIYEIHSKLKGKEEVLLINLNYVSYVDVANNYTSGTIYIGVIGRDKPYIFNFSDEDNATGNMQEMWYLYNDIKKKIIK